MAHPTTSPQRSWTKRVIHTRWTSGHSVVYCTHCLSASHLLKPVVSRTRMPRLKRMSSPFHRTKSAPRPKISFTPCFSPIQTHDQRCKRFSTMTFSTAVNIHSNLHVWTKISYWILHLTQTKYICLESARQDLQNGVKF